jgi:uncharacterized protein (DUF302 family)
MAIAISLIAGLFVGVLFMAIIIRAKAQSWMLNESVSMLGFAETEDNISKSATEMGWKIPKVHDMQETMTNNGYSVRPIKVIEICKPSFAFQILEKDEERIVSSLMPCRIALYEKSDGKVYVSRLNSGFIGIMMKGVIPHMMSKVGAETELILKDVIKRGSS